LKGESRAVIFRRISLITLVLFDLERPNSAGNTCAERHVIEADQKCIFSCSAVNENSNENEIPFTAEKETKTKMGIHFRLKNENESRLIILVFVHTYIQSPSQPYNDH